MKASGSFAAATLWSVQAASRPFTTTGLGGPTNKTSFFSAGICKSHSDQHGHRRFHKSFERGEEFCAARAVDHPMVAGKRHAHHAGKGNAPILFFDGLPARRAHREDGRVRRIDNGSKLA